MTDLELIEELRKFDTPTITNVVATYPGRPHCLELYHPWNENWYTNNQLQCWYPELGPVVGYAVTCTYGLPDPTYKKLTWLDVLEAMDKLKAQGIAADFMRLRGFPFGDTVRQFLETHERIFVVEQNQQGQMRNMLMIETNTPPEKLISVLDYAGLPLTAKVVVDAVAAQLVEAK